jgi:hypothetical protein
MMKARRMIPLQTILARGKRGFDSILAFVMLGPCPAAFEREPVRVINMEDHDHEQDASDDAEERPGLPEMLGVGVVPRRPEENLEVAEEMADDEQNQNHSRHRHNQESLGEVPPTLTFKKALSRRRKSVAKIKCIAAQVLNLPR